MKKFVTFVTKLYVVLTGAYALSIAGLLVVRFLVGDRWMIIGLFNSFIHLMVLPAVVLFPLALISRQRLIAAVLIPGIIATGMWYVPGFIPKTRPTVDTSTTLSVVTFNIAPRADDLMPTVAVIRQLNADVIGIQELSDAAAALFDEQLAELYPYRVIELDANPMNSMGIFSRLPVLETDVFPNFEGKRHQRAVLNWDGKHIVFYNLHAIYPFSRIGIPERANDITNILSRAQAEQLPLILGGDFNLTPQADDYARITAVYDDAFMSVGSGFGFTFAPRRTRFVPALLEWTLNILLARIDYVFYSDDWQAVDTWVNADAGGSDHHPVGARLALRP